MEICFNFKFFVAFAIASSKDFHQRHRLPAAETILVTNTLNLFIIIRIVYLFISKGHACASVDDGQIFRVGWALCAFVRAKIRKD